MVKNSGRGSLSSVREFNEEDRGKKLSGDSGVKCFAVGGQ